MSRDSLKAESIETISPKVDTSNSTLQSSSAIHLVSPDIHIEAPKPEQDDDNIKEGGWGWVVCFTSMATFGTIFANINSFGITYKYLRVFYGNITDNDDLSSKTSLVGSLNTGITFFGSMIATIISDKFGIRITSMFGGFLAATGMAGTAVGQSLEMAYVTYGVVMGCGFAMCFTNSLVILGHYFRRRLGLVNGLVTCGSALATISATVVLPRLFENVGLQNTMLIMAGINSWLVIYAATWRPTIKKKKNACVQSRKGRLLKYINLNIWKNKSYVLMVTALFLGLPGLFVPLAHLVTFADDKFPDHDGPILITYMNITSCISRLVIGVLGDHPKLSPVRMQQIAFIGIGVCSFCIPFCETYESLVVLVLAYGLCEGAFVCLIALSVVCLVGPRDASQALGFVHGVMAFPMMSGPPLAGLLYDRLGGYSLAFHLSGAPALLGVAIMAFIPSAATPQHGSSSQSVAKLAED